MTYDYTVSGQRAAMQDASGVTTYSYDVRDRLIEKATPQGTLTYTYNGAGQLDSIQSNHAGGVDLSYSYDALNRLAKVTDQGLGNADTTYSYDNAGSLAGYVYPNGVETAYTYNALNRLTDMHVAKAGADVARYQYTLGATGNRLSVAELSGRTVNYAYDDLYRLTRETISGVATPGQNGEIAYTYDPVGNRLTRTSTVAGIANQAFTYNANDQLNTDAYDANGNTIGTDGKTYAYDGDNRLISQNGGQVQIVYDGDGNRVAKTVGGVTTQYLVDTLNPTGYAQVLEEIENGSVARRYSYGSDLISQSLKVGSDWQTYFYGYDGHGSVRFLTDASGNVTDRYDYEGFGNLVNQEGTTANSYLYSGEQRDASLGLDYLRARYYDTITNRFMSQDMMLGRMNEPRSLHKYLYVEADPINKSDPSGNLTLPEVTVSTAMRNALLVTYLKFYVIPVTKRILSQIGKTFSLPNYGNWCGPGNGGEEYNIPTTVDDLDRACMWHDLRYKRFFYFDHWADKILIKDIENVMSASYDDTSNYLSFFNRYPASGEYSSSPIGSMQAYYYANAARFYFEMISRKGFESTLKWIQYIREATGSEPPLQYTY